MDKYLFHLQNCKQSICTILQGKDDTNWHTIQANKTCILDLTDSKKRFLSVKSEGHKYYQGQNRAVGFYSELNERHLWNGHLKVA